MRALVVVAVIVLSDPLRVSAQVPDQPQMAVAYHNLLGVRYNPLALVDFARFTFRYRLYENEAEALKANFLGIGTMLGLSPAWGRIGILAEVQPLTVLTLTALYDFVGYFGSFDALASFPSAADDFSDTAIETRTNVPGVASYATYGGQLTLGAMLQVKLGPVVGRNDFRAIYYHYSLRTGDRVFYDQQWDVLVPNEGWIVLNDLDLLGVIPIDQFQLAVGARWSYAHAFYDAGHYLPGTDPATVPDNDVHRLGPLIAFTIEQNPNTRFDRPTIILIVQWHLMHRWRTGADVDTAIPLLALAFTFEGDLLAPDRPPPVPEEN